MGLLSQLRLPPGFRFYPTDEELMVQYLCRQVAGHHFSLQIIAEIDLYKFDPWVLPSKAMFGGKEWYFFSPRERKYPNGSRPNRMAGSGYWKATGTDKVITSEGRKVGIKKALVFYVGKAPKGTKTNWIMHEYRLAEPPRKNGSARRGSRTRRRLLPDAAPVAAFLIVLLLFLNFYGENIVSLHQWVTRPKVEDQTLTSLLARLLTEKDRRKLETTGFACDVAENSIVCVSNEEVRIHTHNNVTVYATSSKRRDNESSSIKPYPRQKDKYLLQWITAVKILQGNQESPPSCQYNHTVPAVVFSSGINGNLFHEFNDIIIPLFITTKHLRSRALFIVEDYDAWFVIKYSKILSRLSSYEVMNPAANASVHCFPGMILGLKYHDNLAPSPTDIPRGYSMRDFRLFLSETYSLKFAHVSQIRVPTLVLLSRGKTRKFLNEEEMVAMIKELGFRVVVAQSREATDLNEFANVINSCTVLVGAHGAGLTNELFLPVGGVMVQVEPLGLEWVASNYFGNPAKAMGVHYLRYKIKPEESSLIELYGLNDSVVTEPESVYAMGYRVVREVYLQQQNIRVNVARFRKTMLQALKLIKKHP